MSELLAFVRERVKSQLAVRDRVRVQRKERDELRDIIVAIVGQ